MEVSLLSPPIAFVILLAAGAAVYWALGRLAPRNRSRGEGLRPYACGEDKPDHMIQPDYGQFLPFAFFFTILHVVALMVTTAGSTAGGLTAAALAIAVVYVVGAAVGLLVLYRK